MSGKCYIRAAFCSLICIHPGLLDDFASDFLSFPQTQTTPLFAPTMRRTLAREGWAVPGWGALGTGRVRCGCAERQLILAKLLEI